MYLVDDFVIKALLAGLAIAIISAPLGCFVVWRKMAYFGDSLAHSAFLGIAFGLTIHISAHIGIIIVAFAFAFFLLLLQQKKILATDTLLGILAHGSLSIGMVAISLLNVQLHLYSYFFGDILTVTTQELLWIYGGGLVVFGFLWYFWQALILVTINEDLARAENVNIFMIQLLFMLLMALIVAVSVKFVGILLVTSMLIIPAASARFLAYSPISMAVYATIIAMISVVGGIMVSFYYNMPTGPTIVAGSACLFFLLSLLFMRKKI